MIVQPYTVNRVELGVQEWRYCLFLRYDIDPPDLHRRCDGFNAKLLIYHTLDWKNGGLVISHHNELPNWVSDLAVKYFTPTHVPDGPLIYACRAVQGPKFQPTGSLPPPHHPRYQRPWKIMANY